MSQTNSAAPELSSEALHWLLMAQLLVVLPHLLYVPLWIIGLELGCLVWRLQIIRGQARYPALWVKVLLITAIGAGIYLSRGKLVGLDAGVVLLIAALILKTLEMQSRRDALVVIFLGFFTVVTSYLFEDSLVAALYSLLPITVLLVAMISLQVGSASLSGGQRFRLAASLLGQALPLMLLLFVFFPRIDPLWSLPQPNERRVAGLADSLYPNALGELTRSSEVAFRVDVEGELPAQESLYWRAITFEFFDGQRWLRGPAAQRGEAPFWQKQGPSLDYSIVMQPSDQPWLLALDIPELQGQVNARMMGDTHLEQSQPISRPLLYRVRSWPEALLEPQTSQSRLANALQLPAQGNPRTRAWAISLRAAHSEPEGLAQAILQYFRQEAFSYTLTPPAATANSIDSFLFETRQGFCAHYAQAMAFALRAAAVPARIVGGYQGGTFNPEGRYWLVRQFDAHAWVEYWIAGRGWVRADPTFQVAPERIQLGFEQALARTQRFLPDAPSGVRAFGEQRWARDLRLAWDGLNHGWQRWVLNYQADQQQSFLQNGFNWFWQFKGQIALAAGALLLVLGLLVLWRRYQKRRRQDPLQRLLQECERLLARHGLVRQTGEGIRTFAQRAIEAIPDQADAIAQFANAYETLRYAEPIADSQLEQGLHQALRVLRRRA